MSYYNEDKLKNDFEKPKFATYEPTEVIRERGTGLTLFIGFIIVVNILALFNLCGQASEASGYSRGSSVMPIFALLFVLQGAVLACALALWNWKSWGYYGLCVAYVLQAIFMLLSGSIGGMFISGIALAILVSLVNNRIEMFE